MKEFIHVPTGMTVIVAPGEMGYLIASCPELPGCHSQGLDLPEALHNIGEAIEGVLESIEHGSKSYRSTTTVTYGDSTLVTSSTKSAA